MKRRTTPTAADGTNPVLYGKRVTLRPLVASDFRQWRDVRRSNAEWLTKWEPRRLTGQPDPIEDRSAFVIRCSARERERQMGSAFGFGVFIGKAFAGEMNLSSIQRGPFQSAYIGYWIAEEFAGQGYTPESLVVVMRMAFEELLLHRVQISIIPRNVASLRVVQKINARTEGIAQRYLEIDGVWEDHERFAMTTEEWSVRRAELISAWIE